MVNITFYVFSTPISATTCPCETASDLYAGRRLDAHSQALVTGGTWTNSTACALISAASTFLLVVLVILLLEVILDCVLHYATDWHVRFFRPFLPLLSPNGVNRTCPGHDRGSACTRQGDPTLSRASVQASFASLPAAGRQQKAGKKRSGRGDDGSDAEDNDRGGKRPRSIATKEPKARVRCPFKDHDPENPEFEKCGTYAEWRCLREHILDRKHRPRERCPTCGMIFFDDIEWDSHTGVEQACQPSPQPLESPFWVSKHQEADIRALSSKGRKNQESIEEMYRKVCKILFDDEIASGRIASGHPTLYPPFQNTDDFEIDDRPQGPWNILTRRVSNLLGMQNVPHDTMMQITDCVGQYLEHPREQTYVGQSLEPEPGEAAVDEHLGMNEASIADWMPPAGPSQGPIPQIPEPEGYVAGRPEGHMEHLFTFLQGGASDSLPVLNDITSSARPPPHFPPTEFTAGSGTSQLSEAAAPESFWDQSLGDTNYLNSMEMPDLEKFDFSVDGFCPDDSMMQFCGEAPEHQSYSEDEDRDAPSCLE